jgi:hypothetical protein
LELTPDRGGAPLVCIERLHYADGTVQPMMNSSAGIRGI